MTMRPRLARWLVGLTVAAFAMGLALADAARAQSAAGEWHGELAPSGLPSLRIGVRIVQSADGKLSGFVSSPDLGAAALPLTAVEATGGELSFTAPQIGGRFEGTWDGVRKAWAGQWSQSGRALPLALEPGAPPARVRPQTPKPPFPYRVEEVSFESAPGVRLAGSLTLPPGKGPFPAAVMITGSGQQDRDETIFDHKPFAVIADALTRKGVAVLRLDDRGAGGSSGDFSKATLVDFAGDTRAAVAFLRARKDIDGRRVGLIGHSEGGMVGPMVAAQDPKIAFVVLMEGPGVPLRAVLKAQREAISRAAGAPPATIAMNDKVSEDAIEAALSAPNAAEAAARARAAVKTDMPRLPQAGVEQIAAQVSSDAMRDRLRADSTPALRKLRMPVLATIGSKDLQVPADQNLPALREALKDDPKATVVELPGLNHLLQTAGTGLPAEYGQIEQTIAPAALATITDWVVAQTRR